MIPLSEKPPLLLVARKTESSKYKKISEKEKKILLKSCKIKAGHALSTILLLKVTHAGNVHVKEIHGLRY